MIQYSELDLPRNSDIERLRRTLDVCAEASLVRARLRDSRYGPLIVTGRLRGDSDLWLGGFFLGSRTHPERKLIDLDLLGSGLDLDAGPMGEMRSQSAEATNLRHGQPVEVTVVQEPYGPFSLAGHLVRAPFSADLLLGGWFVTQADRFASRVVSIEQIRIDSKGSRNVPSALTSWRS